MFLPDPTGTEDFAVYGRSRNGFQEISQGRGNLRRSLLVALLISGWLTFLDGYRARMGLLQLVSQRIYAFKEHF